MFSLFFISQGALYHIPVPPDEACTLLCFDIISRKGTNVSPRFIQQVYSAFS